MGESYDSKIQVWKNTIETNRSTVQFLQEVKENQAKDCNADDMAIDTQIDLTDNAVNAYSSYTPEVLQQATKLIATTQLSRNETGVTDKCFGSWQRIHTSAVTFRKHREKILVSA